MAKLGVIAGLPMEQRLLEPYLSDNLISIAAGLTPYAGQKAAEALIVQGATALLSFGLAGGLNPAVGAGAVVIPAEIRGLSTFPCDLAWTKRLADIMNVTPSLLAHAPEVLASAAAKAAVFVKTGAVAADMESYGVAEVAAVHGLPFVALRVVADTAADTIPTAALKSMTDEGRVRVGAAVWGALRRPWQIPDLVRLGRRTAVATNKLETLARLGAPRFFGLM